MAEMRALILRNTIVGFSLAVLAMALIFSFDVAHLRTLVFGSEAGLLAGAVLTFFLGLTFSAAQISIAVMTLDNTRPPGAARGIVLRRSVRLAPALVRVENRRRASDIF